MEYRACTRASTLVLGGCYLLGSELLGNQTATVLVTLLANSPNLLLLLLVANKYNDKIIPLVCYLR